MSAWDVPAPPAPSQTPADEPVRIVTRGAAHEAQLGAARGHVEALVAATDATRDLELAAQRERERIERERAEGVERERIAQERRDAELRERIDELGAATSEVTSDAVLRLVGWGLGTVVAGFAWQWLTSESRGGRAASRRSRRRHHEART
jgi:hypothetical protein